MEDNQKWAPELYKRYGTKTLGFIEDHIDLIDQNKFDELYELAFEYDVLIISNITQLFLDSNIEHLSYMQSIPDKYLWGIDDITSLTIPSNIKRINAQAFRATGNLSKIIIPDSVEYIGASAFVNTYSLPYLIYEGSRNQWETIEKDINWNFRDFITEVKCTDGSIYY